jgi:hypothetical protein
MDVAALWCDAAQRLVMGDKKAGKGFMHKINKTVSQVWTRSHSVCPLRLTFGIAVFIAAPCPTDATHRTYRDGKYIRVHRRLVKDLRV